MRWIFAGIVALNLAYMAWYFLGSPTAGAAPVAGPEPVEFARGLALLGESGSALPAAPAPDPAVAPAAYRALCPALGPYSADDAMGVLEALQSAGFEGGVRAEVAAGPPVFWVYLPSAETRAAALRQLRELHAKGIDSFVVLEGADANAISLGSFQNRDSALGVQARLRSAGYAAELREQRKEARQAWVVLTEPGVQGFLDHVPPASRRVTRVEAVACVVR